MKPKPNIDRVMLKAIEKKNKQQMFLAAYANKGTILSACNISGVSRYSAYQWINEDQDFQQAYELAREAFIDRLEDEVTRRGMDGIPKPVYYRGELVDTITEYSDTLLMFRLNGLCPEKYRVNGNSQVVNLGNITLSIQYEDSLTQQYVEQIQHTVQDERNAVNTRQKLTQLTQGKEGDSVFTYDQQGNGPAEDNPGDTEDSTPTISG